MSYQNENRRKRSVELPVEIWDCIEKDAKRTRRSANGVVEAFFLQLYFGADVELHGIEAVRKISPVASEQQTKIEDE